MKQLKRIYIFGASGVGKTSFANKLSKILKIRNHDLDELYFLKKYDKVKGKEKRDELLRKISNKKKWIIEGVFSKSWVEPAIKKADLVLILNFPTKTIRKRITLRYLKRKFFTKRKTNIKDTLKLVKYAKEYPKKLFNKQKRLAKKYNKKVIIIKNNKEIKDLLKKLK